MNSFLKTKVTKRLKQILEDAKTKFEKEINKPGVRESQWKEIPAKQKIYGRPKVEYFGDYALITYDILKGWDENTFAKMPITEQVVERISMNSVEKTVEKVANKLSSKEKLEDI